MSNIFGIYVGNSSASIAIVKDDGKVEILANDAGERVTPTVVRLTSKEQVVGSAAVGSLSSWAANTVTRNKTLFDKTIPPEILEGIRSKLSVKTEVDDKNNIRYLIQDEDKKLKFTPLEVATFIFKKLYRIGESGVSPGEGSGGPLSCVVCCPRGWWGARASDGGGRDEGAKDDWVQAASLAGWRVLQVIAESTAPTLAYSLDSATDPGTVLVYRLGGVSCSATVIEFERGFLSVLSSVSSEEIGADRLVEIVTDHLADEFKRKFHLDPCESRKSMRKLRGAAEGALRVLSTLASCSKFVESVCEGVDWGFTLSRARLDALLRPALHALVAVPIADALRQADLDFSNVNKVILVGAPMKTPCLVSYVKSLFPPEVEFPGGRSPDEVMALGAASQASLVSTLLPDRHCPLPPQQLAGLTFDLPSLASPLQLQFSSGEEVTMGDGDVVPCSKSLSVRINENSLGVLARQHLDNGDLLKGEVNVGEFEAPTVLDIQIKATLSNDLLIEAVDTKTKEKKTATIDFKLETA